MQNRGREGTYLSFTYKQIIGLISLTLIGVLIAILFNLPLAIGFLPGYLLLVFMARSKGITYKDILHISLNGIKKTSGVIWILFLVGFLLPSWYMAGTIEQMVAIALHIITPEQFFMLSFIVSMIFSMVLGTCVGTLSSIGIPIISTALALHLPLEIVAGALISGAFVGDRTSPFSSANQLLSNTLEIPLKAQFAALLPTTFAAIFVSCAFYSYLDLTITHRSIPVEQVLTITYIKFIPPMILILVVLLRYKVIYGFFLSIISACLLALSDHVPLIELTKSLWSGINGLGGGFMNMYLLLIFLALAGAYNGLLEELRVLQSLLYQWLETSASRLLDTLKVIFISFCITLIAANQTLPIILTGRSFRGYWSNKYNPQELARVMADSTMLFAGFVPWSVLTIMCSTITGVSVFDFFGYSIFLWILPLLTIVTSVLKQNIQMRAINR
jgi:Na+:H+ antiporter, NhaC family